jgi:small subunit ribosomal protein S5
VGGTLCRPDDPGAGQVSALLTRIGKTGACFCDAPVRKECLMAERENRRGRGRREEETPEFADRLVAINRVSKTVKGGKRFGFAALVVVGDQKGRVGFGKGKAKEVPEAIRKATEQAKRQMIRVPLKEGRTLHHDMNGRHGAGKVVMRTAPEGTGIIAGGPMRAVFEMLGIKDVVSKSIGSQNPYNMIRATINGLTKEQSPRSVAQRRGKKVADILPKRDEAPAAEAAEA